MKFSQRMISRYFLAKNITNLNLVPSLQNIKETNLTYLLFATGTIVLVGGDSKKQIMESIKVFRNTCERILNDNKIKIYNFKITNFCCASNFGYQIDLVKMAAAFPAQVSYETEVFINSKFRQLNENTNKSIIFTVTHKGHVFCTGINCRNNIKSEFRKLYEKIKPFFKQKC